MLLPEETIAHHLALPDGRGRCCAQRARTRDRSGVAVKAGVSRGGLTAPPNDTGVEQCVLGAMLLSVDAVGDVVETVVGADFYRPAHEQTRATSPG